MNTPADTALLDGLLRTADADGVTEHVVGAVIVGADGGVLLLHRPEDDYLGGLWELPSGGVDDGESLTEVLCREVGEETELEVTAVGAYLGYSDTCRKAAGRPGSSTSPPPLPTGRPSRSPSTTSVCGPTASSRRGPAASSGESWPPGGTEPPPESPSAGTRRCRAGRGKRRTYSK